MTERKKFKIPSAEEMDISSTPKIDTFAVYKRQQKEDEMGTKKLEIRKIDSNSEKAEPSAPHHITVNQGTTSSEKTAKGSSKIQSSEVKPGTSKGDGLGLEIPENLQVKGGKTNSIIVNPRQRGNPIIKFIRNVPWEYGDIVPDYLMGQTTCALFLSLRYHQLHPDYIHNRLKQLGRSYELRVMLVQVDVKESHHLLKELAKICVLADCTLILAFSTEEAGRYLETFKVYENKPPDAIMEKTDQDFMSKITECLTNVKSVNKTDTMTLMSTFDTLENVMKASTEDLSLCPGFGPQKAKRLHDVFQEPFLKANKKVKSAESS